MLPSSDKTGHDIYLRHWTFQDVSIEIYKSKGVWKFKALDCKSEKSPWVSQTLPPLNQSLVTHRAKGFHVWSSLHVILCFIKKHLCFGLWICRFWVCMCVLSVRIFGSWEEGFEALGEVLTVSLTKGPLSQTQSDLRLFSKLQNLKHFKNRYRFLASWLSHYYKLKDFRQKNSFWFCSQFLKLKHFKLKNHHCVKCEPKIPKSPLSQFSPLLLSAWKSSLSLLLIKSEEGVGIKLSRGKLTGGLTPVTAAIKHQINRHKPSSPPHLAAPTNTKSGRPGWGQKTNHLSWCLYLAPNYRHFNIFLKCYTQEKTSQELRVLSRSLSVY